MSGPDGSPGRRVPTSAAGSVLAVTACVGLILICWLLLVPPGGQPDEESHIVRAAALIRGADEVPDASGAYLLPDRYVIAEPDCYAFQPTVGARCVVIPTARGDDVVLTTRATDYPWGGHLLFGAAGLLPGPAPIWWGRLAAAAVGTALLTSAIVVARRSRTIAVGALLLGLTPMAWSIVPALNPSSMVTAGAAALWVALLVAEPHISLTAPHRWMTALAWAATVLPRRDGLIWACVIAFFATVANGTDLRALARRLGAAAGAVVAGSTAVVVAWGLTSDASASGYVVLAPIALIGADAVAHWWRAQDRDVATRAWAIALGIVAAIVAWVVVVANRPGGWDTDLVVTVIGQTDENLIEAIGVLGWLDTSIPYVAIFAWLVLVGTLVGDAALHSPRALALAGGLAAVTVITSWTFELVQGNDSGTYWQGRYSLPLLVGVPILLARRAHRDHASGPVDHPAAFPARLDAIVGVAALVLLDVAAWAAARRWGVGTLGTHLPWRWDTPVQPFPVLLLLIVHIGATVGLASTLRRASTTHR